MVDQFKKKIQKSSGYDQRYFDDKCLPSVFVPLGSGAACDKTFFVTCFAGILVHLITQYECQFRFEIHMVQ